LAKFYSDENFPYGSVEALRKLGHDVLTTLEAGHADQRIPDHEVLGYAIRENRIVLTFNRKDFIKLHEKDSSHAGIIVCKVDADFEGLARRIDKAVKEKDTMQNQLVRVNRVQPEGAKSTITKSDSTTLEKEAADETKD
jgi:hypothetical protein